MRRPHLTNAENCIIYPNTLNTEAIYHLIAIDYRDKRPIYEQVKEGLRRLITTGALEVGDRLPPVRELAAQLAINPNTIQRAYRELESEGFIVSQTGRGSFVCQQSPEQAERLGALWKQLDETLRELSWHGVGEEELTAHIKGVTNHGKD